MKVYTIRDVAAKAGVSVTTVSRVLNQRPDVSKDTQDRVRKVMAECHFVVNHHARSLKQAEIETIAVIIRGRQNPFLNALTEEMLLCGHGSKAALLTEYIDESEDEFRYALALLQRRRVTGLIFVGSRIDKRCAVLDGVNIPMVFATVSAEGTPMARASSISIDDRKMACAAVEALLDRGHEQIAVFGGERSGQDCPALRMLGVLDAFEKRGIAFNENYYVKTRFTLDDSYAAAQSFFRRSPEVTAVFCMSDTVALGVIRALADLGKRVPKDVSVIGVDGIKNGQFTVPRLSTIVQPVEEIARKSVSVLRDMLENGAPARHVTVEAKLEIRESVQEAAPGA